MPGVPMKLIDVEGGLQPKIYGLVDSGADYSTLPVEWAEPLGIDLKDCLGHQGGTAGGPAGRFLYPQGIYASILGRKLHLGACFAPQCPLVLLGREDFFRYFQVSFNQAHQTFAITAESDSAAADEAVTASLDGYAERVREHLKELEELQKLDQLAGGAN